ncbi:MAG TPA: hypothetical protein EYH45_06320 [Candidatus Caldiarchaeum subterraneum]|uniref:Uncharacterized protein n=1 Tax=Caldiarchaeum subterraneum TaxID=311458 RepID=A0A832ZWJ7_CALS0|nr:hypothetical protein [Candidatus Caldarchaeum subterraneum]
MRFLSLFVAFYISSTSPPCSSYHSIRYALFIDDDLMEVICEGRRKKYLSNKPVYNTLEEAEEKE